MRQDARKGLRGGDLTGIPYKLEFISFCSTFEKGGKLLRRKQNPSESTEGGARS